VHFWQVDFAKFSSIASRNLPLFRITTKKYEIRAPFVVNRKKGRFSGGSFAFPFLFFHHQKSSDMRSNPIFFFVFRKFAKPRVPFISLLWPKITLNTKTRSVSFLQGVSVSKTRLGNEKVIWICLTPEPKSHNSRYSSQLIFFSFTFINPIFRSNF